MFESLRKQRIQPVSYTHLDVYKRQADDTACLSAQLKSHDFLTIPVPVALMHLAIGCNHVFRYCHKQCSSLFCDSIQFHIVLDRCV